MPGEQGGVDPEMDPLHSHVGHSSRLPRTRRPRKRGPAIRTCANMGQVAKGRVEVTDVEASAAWYRPSAKLQALRRLEVGLVALPLAVGGAVAAVLWVGAATAGAVAGGVILLALLAERALTRRYRSWGYLERADDLLVRRGVLVRRLSVVPYGRMQFVDVTAGLLERLFGIATVRLHTAAAATDARLPGLEVEEAARLREQLTLLGEARAAGI